MRPDPVSRFLFGGGSQNNGLIAKLHIGSKKNGNLVANQNPYENIRAVLNRLGIPNSPAKDHNTHFHIYLRVPTARELPQNLDAEVVPEFNIDDQEADAIESGVNQAFDISYQEDALTGESTMLMSLLMPYLPPLDEASLMSPPVITAQATTGTPAMTLGNCEDVQSPDNPSGLLGGQLTPAAALQRYWYQKFNEVLSVKDAKVTVLQLPKSGVLQGDSPDRKFGPSFNYIPNHGFLGQDKITFLVEVGGKSVKVVTTLIVVEVAGLHGSPCFTGVKRISSGSDTPDLATSLAISQLTAVLGDAAGATVTITSLAGAVLGQTTGTSITLDDNAAGNGWFIDSTPADNSEFLPTSNPNVWQAKAGSDAAGKMDLLSVLLHEYGHALGLDHSPDSGDYMAATLQPGQRRLPSAEELQLMSELVAQLKGGDTQSPHPSPLPGGEGGLPLGALLLGRLALGRRPEDAVFNGSQALFAAHPTLQGGSLQNLQDWGTQGSVTVASGGAGGATLQEGAASQTRLNQIFMLNERDRFLSFTLAGTALDDVNGAPDDAFEVALLEANTGRALTAALSLSRTDALLNLQANGTETTASSVTRVTNADGSRTYRVDLAGIAAGTAVNLSFDLIGFGQAGSQVTVRDVRVSGLPELHDDVASLAEDGALAFDPFAQVDNAAQGT